jgi:exopolyphosphatase/guanosine-5'-triphosphate,3'-diphosphate pyrophosphatase
MLERTAAIYIASSDIIMKIAEKKGKDVIILEDLSYPINLGHDTFSRSAVAFEKIKILNQTINNFKKIAEEYLVEKVKIFATAALREALNKDYIIYQIKNNNQLNVEIFDNVEEHQMIYQGIRNTNKELEGNNLFAYIGTGSLGVAVADQNCIIKNQSITLGSLKISEILKGIQHKTDEFHIVVDGYLSGYIYNLELFLNKFNINNFYASGKEIELIAKLAGVRKKSNNFNISRAAFYRLYNDVKSKTPKQLLEKYDLDEVEAETLLTSMTIYKNLMNLTQSNQIIGSTVTIETEVIRNMLFAGRSSELEKQSFKNIIASSRSAAEKYHYNKKHAETIEKIALDIFDALKDRFHLSKKERLLLQSAVILHDIGKYINLKKHYEHSYYLINNSDIADLNDYDKNIIAHIALNHSQSSTTNLKIKNTCFNNYEQRVLIAKLTSVLKIADALDKSHKEPFSEVEIDLKQNKLVLTINTEKDIYLEKWAFNDKSRIFKEVFGIDVSLNKMNTFI